MKSVTVIETVCHRFDFPDGGLPFAVDEKGNPVDLGNGSGIHDNSAEEWFCNLRNPFAEADYAEVSERNITIEEGK